MEATIDRTRKRKADNDESYKQQVIQWKESIKSQEVLLQSLVDRQSKVLKEIDSETILKNQLKEKESQLQARQENLKVARTKHLALEGELQESLTKSRERLARLGTLVEDEAKEEDDDEEEEESDSSIEEIKQMKIDLSQDEQVSNKTNKSEVNVFSIHEVDKQQPYVRYFRHPKSYLTFVPTVKPEMISPIMLLYAREASALDKLQDQMDQNFSREEDDEDDDDSNAFSRRCLLWNTCLDFKVFQTNRDEVPSLTHRRQQQQQDVIQSNLEQAKITLDPNVPLCPYELAGICADEFCPYQHTTSRRRSMKPRERLPLPPMVLESTTSVLTTQQQKEQQGRKLLPERVQESSEEEEEGEVKEEEEEESTFKRSSIEENEDFISLPTLPVDTNDSESEYSNNDDESSDEAHLENGQPRSLSLWWGGRLTEAASSDVPLSLKDIVRQLGGISSIEEIIDQQIRLEDESISDETKSFWIGRMVGIFRLLIHAGRRDVVHSICGKSGEKHRLLRSIGEMLKEISDGSPFHCLFYTQVSLAALNLHVENMCKGDDVPPDAILKGPIINGFSFEKLKFYGFGRDSSSSTNAKRTGVIKSLKQLLASNPDYNDIIDWIYVTLHAKSSSFEAVPCLEIEDRILKPHWSVVSGMIRKAKEGMKDWRCLQGVVIMGSIILACLEKFANELKNEDDSLPTSLTAALTSMDTTIYRILKDLNRFGSDVQFLELLLSPLFSVCVTTASFLRMYSTAQSRLQSILMKSAKESLWPLFPQYSELLWSQLIHLRMSLPTDSIIESDNTNANVTQYKAPSPSFHKETKMFADRIDNLGLQLRHLALIGDWNLSTACNSFEEDVRLVLSESMYGRKVVPSFTATEDCRLTQQGNLTPLPFSLLLCGHSLERLSLRNCNLKCLPASIGHYFRKLKVRILA